MKFEATPLDITTTTTRPTWDYYLETPRRGGAPMKIDRILKRRMKAFLRARQSALEG